MISLWSSNAMTEYHEKMIFFFSIFIRWSTIMWWITTSRGLPRSNVECKADSIFLLRLHAWCMYSLKLTSESILANWNHEPNSIFLSFFLSSFGCVCVLCSIWILRPTWRGTVHIRNVFISSTRHWLHFVRYGFSIKHHKNCDSRESVYTVVHLAFSENGSDRMKWIHQYFIHFQWLNGMHVPFLRFSTLFFSTFSFILRFFWFKCYLLFAMVAAQRTQKHYLLNWFFNIKMRTHSNINIYMCMCVCVCSIVKMCRNITCINVMESNWK